MRRSLLVLAGALALPLLAFGSSAGAATTCTVSSPNVVGETVSGSLTSRDVDPSQARFATCGYAEKVMSQVSEARIEEKGSVAGFYCQIVAVKKSNPPVLNYSCTFKGADTATFIKLTFSLKFRPSTPCGTSSPNVIGHKVQGVLSARNVNPIQARFATCANAQAAMKKITGLRVEEPRSVRGLYCMPTVLQTEPDLVRYVCLFKGADTPMFVKLVFKVKYDLD